MLPRVPPEARDDPMGATGGAPAGSNGDAGPPAEAHHGGGAKREAAPELTPTELKEFFDLACSTAGAHDQERFATIFKEKWEAMHMPKKPRL